MGVEPKQLGWSRRDDWGSHRQLAHRLETNKFVCELIAATIPDTRIGVTAWGRIDTLRRAYKELEPKRERHRQDSCLVNLDGRWPMLATTTTALHDAGPLGTVWESIADPTQPSVALDALPVSHALGPADLACALGRRWRYEQPGFWDRPSPLHRRQDGYDDRDLKPPAGSDLIDQPHSHDDYERKTIP